MIRRIFLFLIITLCAMTSQYVSSSETIIDLGSRLELFADRYLIDELNGTELRLHSPQCTGAVLQFDNPWEGRYCGYSTTFKDGDKYRLYYRGLPMAGRDGSTTEVTCCAESVDGVTWEKPDLGIYEIMGTRKNNVVLSGMAPCSHNFAPFLDTKPAVASNQRYKALAGTGNSGLIGFVSSDGLHWEKIREEALITEGAFDSQNIAFWSEAEQCYVCYFRTWTKGEYNGYRTISRCTSPDFLNWSDPVEMSFGDTPREHLYTNQTQPYFRAPHLYIALPARFMPGRRVLTKEQFEALGGDAGYSGDCSDTCFMTSRGGSVYDRTFMEGFVRPGLGLNNWSSRTNYTTHGMLPTGPGEISLFIQRNYGQPSHYLERLTLRTDGFASLHAPYTGGEALTKPFRFKGEKTDH